MNASHFAKLLIVCAAGFVAATGAQAKGTLSVGLTIVSSCSVSGASVYRAAATNPTMTAGCGSETSYTVAVSPVAKADASPSRSEQQAGQQDGAKNDAGYVVVTLTY